MDIDYSLLQSLISCYVGKQYAANIDIAKFKLQTKVERELMEGALVLAQYPEDEWVDELWERNISRHMIPAIKEWIVDNLESMI